MTTFEYNVKGKHILGNAHVSGDARVSGDAHVYGDAHVSGDGLIEKTSAYLVIGPAKSSGRFTTAHKDSKIGVRVNCGCFSGTVKEFSEAIEKTHKDNKEHLEQYRLFCQMIAFNFGGDRMNHWVALAVVLLAYIIGGYIDSMYASLAN